MPNRCRARSIASNTAIHSASGSGKGVGKLGSILGEAGVNIADIHLARESQGEEAVAVLRLDNAPSPDNASSPVYPTNVAQMSTRGAALTE